MTAALAGESLPVLSIRPAESSRLPGVDLAKVAFSSVFSDHMLVANYRDGGWRERSIQPFGALPLLPSVASLQYGISVFEGLKAHRTPGGEVATFRPGDNARRLNRSAARLAMPPVPEEIFVDGLRALLQQDRAWVPPHGEGALYIRPCYFSVDESVRVKPSERYLFVIFTFPFASYYADPVGALVSERYVRAFPGGTGSVKPAGNYASALLADREAQALGYQTVMWLDGRERRYVEECGVMNVFFVIDDEVVTPQLGDTILPGITRDSVLTLLRSMGYAASERRIAIDEIMAAHAQGRLRECFGTGTAATLAHVSRLSYAGTVVELPPVEARVVGPRIRERLVDIATGRAADPYGWLERI